MLSTRISNSLAAKLVLQALLAVALVGVSFVMAARERRPRTSRRRSACASPASGASRSSPLAAYVAYFAFALVYSLLVSPHQKDIPADLGYGDGVAGVDRSPAS